MNLEPVRIGNVDRLKTLWLGVHAHHRSVAPELEPYVSDEQSWRDRRRQYLKVLDGEHFGFIAREDSTDFGYLLCAKRPMDWNATFAIPSTLWELVTLCVAPEWRGKGYGTAMLAAMDRSIAAFDVKTKLIGVLPQNHGAVALYKSRGYVPSWLTLARFQREAPVAKQFNPAIAVETLPPHGVHKLESLWLSLHHHHQSVSPQLGPWVDDAQSWSVIRELLAKSANHDLLFVAMTGDNILGLVSAAIYSRDEVPNWSDTWALDNQIAEIKFLSVAPGARGAGIGTALMDAVDRELARRNVRDHLVGAIEPNIRAISFYKLRGYAPAWLELTRF